MTLPVKNKAPVIIPAAALRRAGFKSGQELEMKASGGVITILAKLPSATDEYTLSERRAIDAELAEAEQGPSHGPFATADEMIDHLKGQLKKRRIAGKIKPS